MGLSNVRVRGRAAASVVALTALLLAPAARAGFAAPVRIDALGGTEPLSLAINDRGEAVALGVAEKPGWCTGEPPPPAGRLLMQRFEAGRAVSSLQTLTVPGYFGEIGGISLDTAGRAAVGLDFDDYSSPSSCEPHDEPCCAKFGVATWQRGSVPGWQRLAPRRPDALALPVVAVEGPTVKAVWAASDEESDRTYIEQASGSFGGPLRSAILATAPGGLEGLWMVLRPAPLAAWSSGSDLPHSRLHSAVGLPRASLSHLARGAAVPNSVGETAELLTEGHGNALFAFEGSPFSASTPFSLMRADAAGHFSQPRTIAHVPEGHSYLAVGPGGRLLLLENADNDRIFVRRGSIGGPLGPPRYVGTTTVEPEFEPQAFIDGRGRAVVVFTRRIGAHGTLEVVAATALPNGGFATARPIAPSLAGCYSQAPESGSANSPGATTSPDGHALFLLRCRDRHTYLVSYAP